MRSGARNLFLFRALIGALMSLLISSNAIADQILSGEKLFKMQCATCHSAAAGEPNRQGPNLYGVVGRHAGVAPGMVYSAGFTKALNGQVWTEALLNKWLEDPQVVAPETVMMYHQDDPEKRQLLVEYLKTLH
ncbi:c-type cytochrome [Glaciimonas sp. GG7]